VSVFVDSARYYDAFYDKKDYAAEVDYVLGLLQRYAPNARSILDLGCGTGRHARLMADRGVRVVGVDRSAQMLRQAQILWRSAPPQIQNILSFRLGDISKLRLDAEFDAAVALFHVMSYQISDQALDDTISRVKAHLHGDGIFIFDCWYGPGVLRDPPTIRFRRINGQGEQLLRIAEPTVLGENNVVNVNYKFIVTDPKSGSQEKFSEMHRMRYFFKPEIISLLTKHGFQLEECLEWMTSDAPGDKTWNAVFLARSIP